MIDDETKPVDSKTVESRPAESKPKPPRRRITLDSQLMSYWEREAQRLDALAAGARWRWVSRAYARKAERARTLGARSGAREARRDGGAGPA